MKCTWNGWKNKYNVWTPRLPALALLLQILTLQDSNKHSNRGKVKDSIFRISFYLNRIKISFLSGNSRY